MTSEISSAVACPRSVLGSPQGDLEVRVRVGNADCQVVRWSGNKITLGSAPQATYRIWDDSIRPIQCLILRGETGTVVRNFGAGTRLNGSQFMDSRLSSGDRLQIGRVEFEVLPTGGSQSATEAYAAGTETALRQTVQQQRDLGAVTWERLQSLLQQQQDALTRQWLTWRQDRAQWERKLDQCLDRLADLHQQLHGLQSPAADGAPRVPGGPGTQANAALVSQPPEVVQTTEVPQPTALAEPKEPPVAEEGGQAHAPTPTQPPEALLAAEELAPVPLSNAVEFAPDAQPNEMSGPRLDDESPMDERYGDLLASNCQWGPMWKGDPLSDSEQDEPTGKLTTVREPSPTTEDDPPAPPQPAATGAEQTSAPWILAPDGDSNSDPAMDEYLRRLLQRVSGFSTRTQAEQTPEQPDPQSPVEESSGLLPASPLTRLAADREDAGHEDHREPGPTDFSPEVAALPAEGFAALELPHAPRPDQTAYQEEPTEPLRPTSDRYDEDLRDMRELANLSTHSALRAYDKRNSFQRFLLYTVYLLIALPSLALLWYGTSSGVPEVLLYCAVGAGLFVITVSSIQSLRLLIKSAF